MSVCCTGRHMYVQFVDDVQQHTLAAVSTLDRAFRDGEHVRCDVKGAEVLGRLAAERALAAQIKKVVFDRGGFRYHGRVKALAEAARQGGLEF